MASRMKKIFNRKKDDDNEKPQQHLRAPAPASSDPAIRTSLYESTTAAGLPQTGDYPIKGNDSSVILQAGRKSSVRSMRSRRSSSRGSQYNTPYQAPPPSQYDELRKTPRMSPPPPPPPPPNAANPGPHDAYQDPAFPMGGQDDRRKRWSRTPLPQDFAGLSLGVGHGPTTVTETVTTTCTPHHGPISNRSAPQSQGAAYQNHNARYKAASRDTPPQPYASRGGNSGQEPTTQKISDSGSADQQDELMPSTSRPYEGDFRANLRSNDFSGQRDYDTDLARQKSIPRKEVGSSAQAPYLPTQSSTSSSAQMGHSLEPRASKPLPSAPMPLNNGYETRRAEAPIQPTSILDRSRPVSRGLVPPRDAQDVVNRAKTNTFDTEVIEKVAPAVVHENVSNEVHHIRQEVITREIHTHDVYHRILPVTDVEVLPPRHFLPVEGGGLVEVSASEVPGRGQNWVIAETASKIPSDQAAPQGARQFTARNFPGREGDSVTYMTPEGHERTETTWIHPPELEQGARVTGQSWPMEFGDNVPEKGSYGTSSPKFTKRKSPKKGAVVQASPAQRAGGLGRAM